MFFKFADQTEENHITFNVAVRICRIMEYNISQEELQQCIKFYGKNEQLNLQEFVQFMKEMEEQYGNADL